MTGAVNVVPFVVMESQLKEKAVMMVIRKHLMDAVPNVKLKQALHVLMLQVTAL